jgi:crossover junction endodeoxyribonuclease RuvC
MVILGIDPGTATTGYGVISYDEGRLTAIDVGVLLTYPENTLPERLTSLSNDINALLDRYDPDTVATEKLFFYSNVTNGISVGCALGVILVAFGQRGLPWAEYTPMQVKQAVSGYGGADKQQVQINVTRLLHLTEIPKPDDAADALAVAICHAHSYKLKAMGMAPSPRRGRR